VAPARPPQKPTARRVVGTLPAPSRAGAERRTTAPAAGRDRPRGRRRPEAPVGHIAPPAREKGILEPHAAVARAIRSSTPNVLVVAAAALVFLLVLPSFVARIVRPRCRRP
jgi:hypothetical protein